MEVLSGGGITDCPFRKFSLTTEQNMNLRGVGWEKPEVRTVRREVIFF